MKELTPVMMGWIVLVTQIIFLYLRTLNVKAVAGGQMWKSIWTGWGIALSWMIGITIGANAMMEGNWFPIFMHLVGGTIGTWMGMRESRKKKEALEKLVIEKGSTYKITFPTGRVTKIHCVTNYWIEILTKYVDDPDYKVEKLEN